MKDDLVYIEHILEALQRINFYTVDMDEAIFFKDTKTQDACIRQFEVVGEAAKRLSLVTRNRFAQIPWKSLAGMRDKLIHDYVQVSLEIVWATIANNVTPLLIELEGINEQLRKEESNQ